MPRHIARKNSVITVGARKQTCRRVEEGYLGIMVRRDTGGGEVILAS
jgi:hypothetical protein